MENFKNLPADRIYYVEEGVGELRTSSPRAAA